MSNNLNLALRLAYDGKAVTQGARQNVRELNQIPQAVQRQVAANQRLSVSQQRAMSQQGGMAKSLNLLERSYSGVATAITAAISAGTAGMFIRDTGAAQLLDQRLKGLTDSASQYNQVQEYLFATADRLNTKYSTLANSYSKILNLQQAGVLTSNQSQAILEGMANAAAKAGASNVQLEQSLYGMTQGMTAGVLRAEELNQVTEPLPGLMQRLDKASGQVAGGFRKMVIDGQVTSQMFKRYLIKALGDYAGAAQATEGKINASLAEMSTEYQRLIRQYEAPVNFAVTDIIGAATDSMAALRKNEEVVTALAYGAGTLATVLSGHLVASLAKTTTGFAASIAVKNRALVTNAALAKQNLAQAVTANQLAISEQKAAISRVAATKRTALHAAAVKNLSLANNQATATELALAAATNTYTAAAGRATLASRALSGTMFLLGGPVGAVVTAAIAIAYFASSSDDASKPTKELKQHVYDLTDAFDSLNNQSARIQISLNSKKAAVFTSKIKKARKELAKFQQLENSSADRSSRRAYREKIKSIRSYITEQTGLRAVLMESNVELASFDKNLDKLDWQQSGPSGNAGALPENIKRLELSLMSEEARIKAGYENKRQMVIRASETDLANKAKYNAILKSLDNKYNQDVLDLNQKREQAKTRLQNEAEEARKNQLNIAFENKLAVIKGHTDRETLAAYSSEMALEQARHQARVDAKRRGSMGLAANDEAGELSQNADNQIREIERQDELLATQGFQSQQEANEAAHQERMFQLRNQNAGAMRQSIVAFANFEKKTELEKSKTVVGLGAAAFKQMAGQSKRAFKAYKAFAIAQAVINTYQSATGAFNSLAAIPIVGPVLGGIAAAAAVASGLMQVRQIKAQQPAGIAHGGLDYVPNESTYILQRGERVLSPKQNIEISAAAQRINQGAAASGGQSVSFVITNNIEVTGGAADEEMSQEIGEDIGRKIESYVVNNIQSNGSIIRAVRSAA